MLGGVGIVVTSGWETEVLEIFYILMRVVMTWICTYVKGHLGVYLRSMHTLYMSYINKEKSKFRGSKDIL